MHPDSLRALRTPLVSTLLLFTLVACGGSDGLRSADRPGGLVVGQSVFVNGVALTEAQLDDILTQYGVAVQDGRYWYDKRSGLFGPEGDRTLGVFVAGLEIGGRLAEDASHGDTDVFVNGRRLRQGEVDDLERLFGTVPPDHYWLNANGDVGVDAYPDSPIANLWAAVSAAGGDGYYGNISTGTYANSQGGCSYVMVDGASVTSGCG